MSFFCGRFSDGKTVVSLNTATGGTIDVHKTPNDNTIFHSDMPIVGVTGQYTATLGNAGNGYFVCQMPAEVVAQLNTGTRVVLAVLTYTYNGANYTKVIQGSSSFHGQFQTGAEAYDINANIGSGSARFAESGGYSRDLNLACGTYNYNATWGHINSIARQGTGGILQHEVFAAGSGPGPNWLPRMRMSALAGLGYVAGATSVPISTSDYYLGVSWRVPVGSVGQGHQWWYVSNQMIRAAVTGAQMREHGANFNQKYSGAINGYPFATVSSAEALQASATAAGVTTWTDFYSYAITPVSMTWYVTNISYSNGAYSVAENPFTGSSIKLSKSEFIIKGVNLGTLNWLLVNQVATANVAARGDMVFTGLNPTFASATAWNNNRGNCGIPGSSNGTTTVVSNPGSADINQLSFYKFNASNSWSVNTNTNTIANGYGTIWSPSQIPLKYFAGRSASVYIGNDLVPTDRGNGYTALATVNLGLPATRTCTVIMATHMLSGAIHKIAGVGTAIGGNSYRLQRRDAEHYTSTDGLTHQILVLPSGRFAPFHVARFRGISSYGTTTGDSYFSVVFLIKNNGNGTAEIGCTINGLSVAVPIFLPYFRISIQRLT